MKTAGSEMALRALYAERQRNWARLKSPVEVNYADTTFIARISHGGSTLAQKAA